MTRTASTTIDPKLDKPKPVAPKNVGGTNAPRKFKRPRNLEQLYSGIFKP